jgi:integrase
MSITKRQTKSGWVYDVRLRDAAGRVYTRTFRTKKEADRFESTEKADRARGVWIDPRRSSDKVADVVAEWLESNPRKKGSSLARDKSIVKVHILPLLGKYPIGDVTPADVQRVVNTWSTRLGARSVRRHYAVLSAIMTFALDTDRIVRSPCRRIRLPEPEPVRQMAVTPEQLHGLADAVGADTGGMVYLAAVLGLRWGECAGLRVGAIDFLNRTVTVESQLTRGLKGRMVTGSPKWNSTRTMAAPEVLLEQLATHLRRRGLTGAVGDSLVFCAPDGQPLHYSNWRRRVWVPACQSAGLEGFQFKMLRTANATVMVAMAIDVKTVQTRVGHRRATTTLDIYAQPTAAADRGAAEALGVHFLGSPRSDEPSEGSPAPPSRASRAMNARWMSSEAPNGYPEKGQETAPDQGDDVGGASKNRTCDLSIISAAL